MVKEVHDQKKVLLLDDEKEMTPLTYPVRSYFGRQFDRYNDMVHPITTICTTSMEPGGFLPYYETPIPPPILTEWRCESCGSVMLSEHRKCEECGKPRHFLYQNDEEDEI